MEIVQDLNIYESLDNFSIFQVLLTKYITKLLDFKICDQSEVH